MQKNKSLYYLVYGKTPFALPNSTYPCYDTDKHKLRQRSKGLARKYKLDPDNFSVKKEKHAVFFSKRWPK